MDQPGKVANPVRGQLNRENNVPLSPCVPENLVSRDGFSRPVPRQPAHLHTQAESRAYLRDSSRVPRRRPFMKPPYAIGSFPSLSGHAIAYRWRSLPRVCRHRASKPQGEIRWKLSVFYLFSRRFLPYISVRASSKLIFFSSLWPYAGGGHNTSTVKGLDRWSLPPKSSRKTTDSLSHNPFLISRTYCTSCTCTKTEAKS